MTPKRYVERFAQLLGLWVSPHKILLHEPTGWFWAFDTWPEARTYLDGLSRAKRDAGKPYPWVRP